MSSPCPFCHLSIPLLELELHANNHLVEDELAKDMELAQCIALAPSPLRVADKGVYYGESSQCFAEGALETSTSWFNSNSTDCGERNDQEKISCLIAMQIRSIYYKVEGGLMALLKKCLELENENSRSIISCHVDHFQSIESEDSGWGCGWRNIQMLSSHLLMQRQEVREVMFSGSGFIPDISSLQRWLEIAWEMGFDTFGSNSFNHKIYGSTKWIGTTECAALFRSFGLRARIADFGCKSIDTHPRAQAMGRNIRGKRKLKQVNGPMDKFLISANHGIFPVDPMKHEKPRHLTMQSEEYLTNSFLKSNHPMKGHDTLSKVIAKKVNRHQLLVEWVWDYFGDRGFNRSGDSQHVIVSEKTMTVIQELLSGFKSRRDQTELQNDTPF
ncbi:peptidase C78, ubiquitin fold modifier-specific peptidase 1/ 2 isoform X2 [Tasmannia lanceolata]|uniref:peptidase C78, ubiquitin fold modifier-specific peptidase 1/ 2 isoform X2 n=1 Tax=Tasmannia lanceolata TaxID=3420 RepID=UPI004062F002